MLPGIAWWKELWDALQSAVGHQVASYIGYALLFVLLYPLNKVGKFVIWAFQYFKRVNRTLHDVARQQTTAGLKEGKGLWLAEPITRPKLSGDPHIRPPPILVIANAKGGVGKTTVAANIAARFAELASDCNKKPILLVDLDFQGSLSSMSVARGANGFANGHDSKATYLISGDLEAASIVNSEHATVRRNGHAITVDKLKIVTAHYDLAQAENRVMIEWLLSDRRTDIRFRLMEVLSNDAVRDAFSAIIIDSPPRLTTGAIQALAAGTHLLIPTILDEPSFEAVLTFIGQVETFREKGICPMIQHAGVVGTMIDTRQNFGGMETKLRDRLQLNRADGGAGGIVHLLPRSTFIPDSVKFRDAGGKGIAYLVMGDGQDTVTVKSAIRELASVMKERMSLWS